MKLNNREKRDTSKLRMVATKSDKANRQKRSAPMMRVSKQLKAPRMLEKSAAAASVELKNSPMAQLQMGSGGSEASLASSNSASNE